MTTTIGRNAIVIGAGMSGLPAARVLADYFDAVTILERDAMPANGEPRPGVPQARHQHGLLGGGQHALNRLFPGLDNELSESGAVRVKINSELRIEKPGSDVMPQRDFGWTAITMSRPLLESVVRRRALEHPRITMRLGRRAMEIVASSDGTAVTGVRGVSEGGAPETLPADFVVDASGRGNLILALLRSVGSPLPEETVIGVDRFTATTIVTIPDDAPTDWKIAITSPDPSRGGRRAMVLPIEGNRWMMSSGAQDGVPPPSEWRELLDYIRQIRTSTIYNAIRHSEPLQPIVRYSFTESVWRHFERLEALPRGVLPIGDAFCRFNPIYGQGMAVAAQEACLLRDVMQRAARSNDPLMTTQQSFLRDVTPLIEGPWVMSAVNDFNFPGTRGERPKDFEATVKFGAALERLAMRDPAIQKLATEVTHLLKPRSVYRDPAIYQRVAAEMADMATA